MYIRRKVFSVITDENGEERLFSTTEFINEDEYLSEKLYTSDGDLTLGDKLDIAIKKHLTTKKDKEAMIEALEEGKYHKLGKQAAKYGAVAGALSGAVNGALIGGLRKGVKGAVLGGLGGTAIGAGAGSAGGYLGTRVEGGLRNIYKDISGRADTLDKMRADRVKVAAGKMTKEEFKKKWRVNKKD